jgi:hypothetical protein
MGTISVFLLERYNVGEVTAEEKAAVDRALAADEGLAGRLAALRESDAALRRRYLPAETKRMFPVRRRSGAVVAAATAAAMCVVLSALWGLQERPSSMGDRAKGEAGTSLAVYLKAADTGGADVSFPQAVSGGDVRLTLHEGDTVQRAYTAAPPRNTDADVYGVIFSIDGRSALTLHYPSTAEGETRLAAGKRTALDEAYTLDDAPRFEVFFMVVSAEPLEANTVLSQARTLAVEAARDGFADEAETVAEKVFAGREVESLIIYKE